MATVSDAPTEVTVVPLRDEKVGASRYSTITDAYTASNSAAQKASSATTHGSKSTAPVDRPMILQEHFDKALQETRPSLSESEHERYNSMYAEFNGTAPAPIGPRKLKSSLA